MIDKTKVSHGFVVYCRDSILLLTMERENKAAVGDMIYIDGMSYVFDKLYPRGDNLVRCAITCPQCSFHVPHELLRCLCRRPVERVPHGLP